MSPHVPRDQDLSGSFILLRDLIEAVAERVKTEETYDVKIALHWITRFYDAEVELHDNNEVLRFDYESYELEDTSYDVHLNSVKEMWDSLSGILYELTKELKDRIASGILTPEDQILGIYVTKWEFSKGRPLLVGQDLGLLRTRRSIAHPPGGFGGLITIRTHVDNRLLMTRGSWMGLFKMREDPIMDIKGVSFTLAAPVPSKIEELLMRMKTGLSEAQSITRIMTAKEIIGI